MYLYEIYFTYLYFGVDVKNKKLRFVFHRYSESCKTLTKQTRIEMPQTKNCRLDAGSLNKFLLIRCGACNQIIVDQM